MKPQTPRSLREMLNDPRPFSGGDFDAADWVGFSSDQLTNARDVLVRSAEPLTRKHEAGEKMSFEESKTMRAKLTEINAINEEIRSRTRPGMYGSDGDGGSSRSGGGVAEFVGSQVFRSWVDQNGSSTARSKIAPPSAPVSVPGALRSAMGARALVSSADDSAGSLVPSDRRGMLVPGLVRPLMIRDLVTILPTESDAIEYVKETSRVNAAAPTAESTSFTGDSGTKPEGGIVWETVTDRVKTIALFCPVTTRVLRNAPAIQALIEGYLRDDIAVELEDQMVSGDGTGEDFLGILNAGIQVLAAPADDVSIFSQIRKAKTAVQVASKRNPSAVVINPYDSESIDLAIINAEANHFLGDPFTGGPGTLWGMPRIESEAVGQGEALVGDFAQAVLWDRQQTTIYLGYVDKQFVRNQATVLGEMDAAFGVMRSTAFARVPLYSGGASSA